MAEDMMIYTNYISQFRG